MKSTFITIALLISLILILIFTNVIPFSDNWSNNLQALAVVGAFVLSIVALYYAKKEYDYHKMSKEKELLCKYLERYADAPYIKKVEEYICEVALMDEDENIIGFDKNKTPSYKPSIWEKEMFMHFFEELQIFINNKMLDKNEIIDLIGYYAGIFHKFSEYHSDITDYEDERYWKYYLQFVRSIPEDFLSTTSC